MRKALRISILEIRYGKLYIAGKLFNYRHDIEKIHVVDNNGDIWNIVPVKADALDTSDDGNKEPRYGFFYEIFLPLCAGTKYSFICNQNSSEVVLNLKFGKYSRLVNIEGSYFLADDFAVRSSGSTIEVLKADCITRIKLSFHRDKVLANEVPSDIMKMRRDAIKLKKNKKPIWLISDRSDSAGDNGQALFEYLMKDPDNTHARDKYDLRFVISNGPDRERMKKIGQTVEAGSNMHKLLHVASTMVISSAADEWIRNPLGRDLKYFRDIIDNRFVFLQHGVIKDDLSVWLHKVNKNFDMFITSSHAEWQSVCDGRYGYDSNTVKLTGLARYDKLVDSPKKTVAILPTWRKYAAPAIIKGSSDRPYSENFKNTEYFQFYNTLINDPILINAMKRHGYNGVFYNHPNHMKQSSDFSGNDIISVWQGIVPFGRVFSESSLLVTDYSSVAIDFAYLGKPVVYTQFDKEKFFSTHSYVQGYYDYEKDGFGPVCIDYNSAIRCIVKIIESGCAEPDIYKERVDRFFAFHDSSNCRRIYEELLKL